MIRRTRERSHEENDTMRKPIAFAILTALAAGSPPRTRPTSTC